MSVEEEPIRLRHAASGTTADVRNVLDSAGADVAPPAELAKVRMAVLAASAAQGANAGASSSSVASKVLGAKALLGALGVVVLVMVAATWMRSWFEPVHTSDDRPHATQHPVATSTSGVTTHETTAPVATTTHETTAPVATTTRETTLGEAPQPTSAPTPTTPRHSPVRVAPRVPQAETALRTPTADELALLAEARRAVRAADGARALSLIREHAHRYPNGMLEEEREALGIEALSQTGQQAAAHQALDRFLRAFPGTAYGARLRGLVGP